VSSAARSVVGFAWGSSGWLLRATPMSFATELHAGEEALKKRSVEVEYSKDKHVQRSTVL